MRGGYQGTRGGGPGGRGRGAGGGMGGNRERYNSTNRDDMEVGPKGN